MTGVGQPAAPVRCDAQRQTSGMGGASSTESLVQLLQHHQRIRIVVGCGADRTDDQGYQHSSLQTFAGDVAGDDQYAAVGGVRQDLKEVSSYLACGALLAFNAESGNVRQSLRNQDLLHRLGLEYIFHHGLLPPLRAAEMTQEEEGEAHQTCSILRSGAGPRGFQQGTTR